LSNGTRWLILGGVILGGACLIFEPCGAIVGGAIEATGPPMAVVPGGALTTIKGIGLIDDALNAGTKTENAVAKDAAAAESAAARGLGGVKYGVTPDEITKINRGYGGETLFNGSPDNMIVNMDRYNSFWEKSAVAIRDIAGGHMFNNGNKRTAQIVVETLMERNGVTSGPTSADLRGVIDSVGKGQLHDVEDIAKALRGY
jgi:hypothetical protein